MTEITITDLFEGAYLLTQGHSLARVTVHGQNGKTQCLFIFTGPDVDKASDEYRSGDATVNIARLKFSMETLKNRMFSSLRHHSSAQSAATSGRKGAVHARNRHTQNPY